MSLNLENITIGAAIAGIITTSVVRVGETAVFGNVAPSATFNLNMYRVASVGLLASVAAGAIQSSADLTPKTFINLGVLSTILFFAPFVTNMMGHGVRILMDNRMN